MSRGAGLRSQAERGPEVMRAAAALGAVVVSGFGLLNLIMNRQGHLALGADHWQWLPSATALGLTLCGMAVMAAVQWGPERWLARGCGVAALAWCALIVSERLGTTGGPLGGRLSPSVGVMALLAAALAAGRRWRSAGWALLALVVALTGVAEVLLSSPWRVLGPGTRPLNPAAALGIAVLSTAWLCAAPERRPAAFLLEHSSAGWLTRRLLPLLLLLPFLLAWMHHEQSVANLLGTEAGLLLVVLLLFVVIITLIWKAASALDRVDTSRADLQAYAREVSDLYDRAPCGYFSLDAEARLVRINDTALAWLGYTRQECEGRMSFADLLSPESRELWLGQRADWRRAGRTWEVELTLLRKNRSAFPAVVTSTAVTDAAGRFLRTRSTMFDATQRKLAEAALRSSEERLRLLLDSTSEGIYATDLEGRCTLCNPAAVRLLGYDTPSQLLGQPMFRLVHHAPVPLHDAAAVSPDATDGDRTEVLWRADGTSFPAEIHRGEIRRASEVVGEVVIFADVTTRRDLELQIRQAQKMEAIGRLAAGVAHDFNNLLTVINGYADMLADSGLTAAAQEKLGSIRQAGARAARLTHQLLAFSRQQMLEPRVLDLNQAVREIEGLLRRTIGEDIELSTELAPELRQVRADASQLDQVLMNLVVNARDAMPSGGTLLLRTANVKLDGAQGQNAGGLPPGEYVRLSVHDSGTGMRPETQAHIFEPFFTTKPPGQGTGLGLPTVFGIARQSGGSVQVESEWGRGTVVHFFLPAHMAGADSGSQPRLANAAGAARGGDETILLVEDDEDLRGMLADTLRQRGYHVLDAAGPREAMALSGGHAGAIDLLLADVVLPAMNGRVLASRLLHDRPQMRVLMTSGYASQAGGPMPFLGKPFAPEVLARTVRGILDNTAAIAAGGEC